jgi:hypothetical protein
MIRRGSAEDRAMSDVVVGGVAGGTGSGKPPSPRRSSRIGAASPTSARPLTGTSVSATAQLFHHF